MNHSVLLSVHAGVATLTFNRPEVYNALDADTMIQFRAAAELLEKDPAARAVVLRGEGKAFIAGGDVAVFHAHVEELPNVIVRWGREMHFGIQALRRMGKPVLASVQGACAGAGLSILCATDLAIAADNARFSLAYANIGASPDGGSSHFLPRLMGYKRAMELALLPELFDAKRALELGLVNWVVPAADLAQETERIAQRLANGPTLAYGEAKRLMNQSFARGIETQMEEELQAFARCAATHDLREGVRSFVEKRKPEFKGE